MGTLRICTVIMQSISIIFVASLVLYASASDSVVPEDALFALDDDLSEARSTLTSLQQAGKSWKECEQLVKDDKAEVEANVKNAQKIINSLEVGHQQKDRSCSHGRSWFRTQQRRHQLQ